MGEIGVRVVDDRALLGMSIVRAYRGRGIGRALMDAMIESLRARAIRIIELHVYEHNAAAIGLYRSLGFVETGEPEMEERSNGERWRALPMTLEL